MQCTQHFRSGGYLNPQSQFNLQIRPKRWLVLLTTMCMGARTMTLLLIYAR